MVVEIFLVFLFFLAIVMLVGHGLWVLVSWLFRALAGSSKNPSPTRWEDCAGCGQKIAAGQSRCPWCGLEQASPWAAELADLRATARQLYRFQQQGLLDITALERFQGQIEARRRALTGKGLHDPRPAPVVQPAREEPAARVTPAPRIRAASPRTPVIPTSGSSPAPVSVEPLPVSSPSPPFAVTAAPRVTTRPREESLTAAAGAATPRPPRRSFAELLAAFMEQRNILWGEVVGGLLIVGCSIALVISLWKTLEENPLYQAAIFVSVTAGLFGAGLYTLSHWKLESTSRGLLVIATLLVPLNLLAMTTGQAQGGSGPLALGVELAAVLIFGGLLSLAGKVLIPESRGRFAVTILAIAAWQLLVARWLKAPASSAGAVFLLLGGLPVIGHCLSMGSVLYTTTRRGRLQPRQASALYGLLGMSTFTVAVTLGQLIFRSVDLGGSLADALVESAPLIGLAGWPLLLGGIHIRASLPEERPVERLDRDESTTTPARTAGLRIAGTAATLLGMVILTAAVVLAWPRPVPVIVTCALNVLVLTYVAFRHQLPVVHGAVILCLMLGYLAAFDLITGKLGAGGRLGLDLAITAASGQALAGLALGLALAAEGLSWKRLSAHGIVYAAGAGCVALVSLLGVTFPSQGAWALQEPVPALIVYAIYGAGCLAMNLRQRRPLLSSLGLALLVAATLWVLWAAWPRQVPHWGAVLAIEALVLGLLAIGLGHPRRGVDGQPEAAGVVASARSLAAAFAEPLARSAEAAALLALVAGIWGGISILAWSPDAVLTGGCLTGLFLLLATREQRWLPANLAGCLLTVTAVVFTGWVGTLGEVASLTPWLAFAGAAASTFMAAVAVGIGRPRAASPETARWSLAVLGTVWLETAAAAGILALILVGISLPAGPSPLHTYTGGLLTVTALLLAWGYQAVGLSWLGAVLALGSITHAFVRTTDLAFPAHVLDFALLTHATLLLLVGLGLRRAFRAQERVTRLYTEPFRLTGLIASFGALPLLLWPKQGPLLLPTLGLFWLSAIWLAIAWLRRWPELFTAFQAVLTLAVVFASLTWLARQDWFQAYAPGDLSRFGDPRSWHAYGLGLAFLSLGWVVVRIAGRAHPEAQALLEPGWPGVDRLVLIGLVIGQAVLAILAVAPALAAELSGPALAEAVSVWPALPRTYALGLGAWMLVGLLGLTLFLALWERWAAAAVLGLVVLAITVPILWAGAWETVHATGLALRWGLAGALLVIAPALWGRHGLQRLAAHLGWSIHAPFNLPQVTRVMVNVLTAIPVILLTILAAFHYQGEEWLLGSRHWLLAGIGPLVGVCLVWVGHGWRERSAGYVFVAGWVVNLAASLIVWHFHPFTLSEWRVLLVQVNVIVAALVALLWLGLRQRLYHGPERFRVLQAGEPFLVLQMALVLIGNVILLLEPLTSLILKPDQPLPVEMLKVGQLWGWVALILALMVAAGYALQAAPAMLVHVLCGFGLAFGALAACALGQSEGGNWSAFHGLLAAWTGAGAVALALGWTADAVLVRLIRQLTHGDSAEGAKLSKQGSADSLAPSLQTWVRTMGLLAVLLALRSAWADGPGNPDWPAGATLAVSLTIGAVALWSRQAADVYASGLLLNLVGGLLWMAWSPGNLSHFAATQILCLAIGSESWSALGLGFRRQAVARDWPAYPHFAAILGLCILGVLAAAAVVSSINGATAWAAGVLTWAALGGMTVALVLLLWDASAPFSLGGLYAIGLMAVGLALHGLNLSPRGFGWTAALILALFVLLVAQIAWSADRLPGLRQAVRLPERAGGWSQPWYLPAQGTVAGLVLILSVWMSLDFILPVERLAGPLALVTLVAAGVLTAARPHRWAALLQTITLLMGVAVVVEVGWALLDPAGRAPAWLWLYRTVIGMVALALMTVLYGLVFSRWLPAASGWTASSRRLGPVLGILAALLVAAILVQEATLYNGRQTITTLAIVVVAAALLTLIGAGIRFAVWPGADPLSLSERGRTLYVYGVEVLLVLMFVHLRLTVPGIFRLGFFLQFWPFVIMALAFGGVALGEFLSRQGIRVLAEPLERTGVFLPLLPVLAFWVLPGDRYALLWFTAGLVYAFLFVTRRSFLFGLLAALAANMGLWVLLYHHEWHFYVHPQVWLIPLALIALVSEHHNRDRLTPYQSAGLRYLALLVLYLSSTADLFIAGLGRSLVLTLVLTVLSILGVLAGMLLRVRAFLFLGVTFLLLDILTIIWHAGVDQRQTWVLWSSGIVLGVAILTLFGIFEKRRNDVLRLVDELRQWD